MLDFLNGFGKVFNNLKGRVKKKGLAGLFTFGDFNHSYNWNRHASLSLYEKSLYANKAISQRALKVGQLNFTILDREGNQTEKGEAMKWLNLLDRPNKHQTGDQFWQLAQKYYDVVGAAFILKKSNGIFGKMPDELKLLRSDKVEVLLSKDGTEILGFQEERQGTNIPYDVDDIIYIYRPDPRNPLLGESLLSASTRAIDTEVSISEYHANVLKNGGKLESIFKIKEAISPEQVDELQSQYEEKYSEARRAGRPLFLGGDIELITTGLKPSELSFLETKISTLDDVCVATGVPKVMLGIGSKETFANADAEIRMFLRDTIKPLMENLVNILNWRLIPDDFELSFVDPTPEDNEEKRKNIKLASDIYSLTTNQKIELTNDLLGIDNPIIKQGDEILIPFNLSPLKEEKIEQRVEEKKKFYHPLRTKEVRSKYGMKKDALMTGFEKRMLKETKIFFDGQKERVLEALGETKKRKDLLGFTYDRMLEVSLAKKTLLPILKDIYIENGQDTAETFGLDFIFSSSVLDSIEKRADLFSDSIINTSREQLIREFTESFENKESRAELVKRIEGLYQDISKGRAEVIARTEVHAAVQNSTLETYKQAGMPTKIWVTVGDERVRPEHEEIDGEEVPIDGVFSNGLETPSEPNCRCQI